MRFIPLLIAFALPLAAMASNYSAAPLLVVSEPAQSTVEAIAPTPLYGSTAAPATPPRGPAPQAPAASTKPDRPDSPVHAASPYAKLWPRDAVPIFMTRCTKFHTEAIKPCSCIITNVMSQFPHDEFMKLSDAGSIETDPRLLQIRSECLAEIAPQDLKKRNVNPGQD